MDEVTLGLLATMASEELATEAELGLATAVVVATTTTEEDTMAVGVLIGAGVEVEVEQTVVSPGPKLSNSYLAQVPRQAQTR